MAGKEHLFSVTKNDLVVETFKAGGKGGQHQNKTNSGVRIRHIESGAVAESREFREQIRNKRAALKKLSEHGKFRWWVRQQADALRDVRSVEQRVDAALTPSNIRIEVKDEDGRWAVESDLLAERARGT